AQKPILTQFGFVQSEKFGRIGSFRLRPSFYDMVSPDAGRPTFSSLAIMDLELNATEDRLWIQSFNLISVETLNLSKTNLEGDGGFALRFNAGMDQMKLACRTCNVIRGEFGIGKAWEVSNSVVLYVMVDPRVQSAYQDSGFLSVKPSLSALVTLSNDVRISAV